MAKFCYEYRHELSFTVVDFVNIISVVFCWWNVHAWFKLHFRLMLIISFWASLVHKWSVLRPNIQWSVQQKQGNMNISYNNFISMSSIKSFKHYLILPDVRHAMTMHNEIYRSCMVQCLRIPAGQWLQWKDDYLLNALCTGNSTVKYIHLAIHKPVSKIYRLVLMPLTFQN